MIARLLAAAAPSLALLSLTIAQPAVAVERAKFSAAALQTAQAAGRPVLVDVAAWWCPVCRSQTSKIDRLSANPKYDHLLILRLDYDGQKPEWRALGVDRQATLIGFHGRREVGRVAFQTDEALIAGLLDSTLK